MSAMGGFDIPILHGLCTYGFTARSLAENFKIDLKHMSGRFTGHVIPGETLVVQAWKEGDTVVFQTTTKERKLPVLIGYAKVAPAPKL